VRDKTLRLESAVDRDIPSLFEDFHE
jgi:hypothetical protein